MNKFRIPEGGWALCGVDRSDSGRQLILSQVCKQIENEKKNRNELKGWYLRFYGAKLSTRVR